VSFNTRKCASNSGVQEIQFKQTDLNMLNLDRQIGVRILGNYNSQNPGLK